MIIYAFIFIVDLPIAHGLFGVAPWKLFLASWFKTCFLKWLDKFEDLSVKSNKIWAF